MHVRGLSEAKVAQSHHCFTGMPQRISCQRISSWAWYCSNRPMRKARHGGRHTDDDIAVLEVELVEKLELFRCLAMG